MFNLCLAIYQIFAPIKLHLLLCKIKIVNTVACSRVTGHSGLLDFKEFPQNEGFSVGKLGEFQAKQKNLFVVNIKVDNKGKKKCLTFCTLNITFLLRDTRVNV